MHSDTNNIEHDPGAPLAGRSVVVTRTAEQSRALSEPLEALGATVVVMPVIATIEPDDWSAADAAIEKLGSYDWVVLTSANAVKWFVHRLDVTGHGADALSATKVAVVGSATAAALAPYGVEPDLMPADYRAEGLVDEFVRLGVGKGDRVLVPRALKAREVLPESLRERGATVDVAPVYRTVPAPADPVATGLVVSGGVDAVTFTSPSTFRNFHAMLSSAGVDADAVLRTLAIASIGPVTSDAVRDAGHVVAIEPDVYTVDGLVASIAEYFVAGDGASAFDSGNRA